MRCSVERDVHFMKALVLTDIGEFSYQDIPTPTVGADEVLVRIKACAICGSDVHGYDGSSGRRTPPLIMGHEASGVIEMVGTDIKNYAVGDRVTFDSTVYCGTCWYCRHGMVNLCENRMVLGVSCDEYTNPGAMAEYAVIKARTLFKLPDRVSFEQAAMVEPLSIAVHAVATVSPISMGSQAVIVGAGTIGLLLTQVIKTAGVTNLIVIDIDDQKLELAKKLGATYTINSAKEDVGRRVRDICGDRGADIAFEAVGVSDTLHIAIQSVRFGGSVIMLGNLAHSVDFPLQKCVTEQITLYGSCASSGEYDICLDLIAHNMVNVDILISAVVPLEQGAAWFDRLHAAEAGLIKVVLKP